MKVLISNRNTSKIWISLILGLFVMLSFSHLVQAASPMRTMVHEEMGEQDCFSSCSEAPVQNSCLEHCLGNLDIISVDSLQLPQQPDHFVFVPATSKPLILPKKSTTFKPQITDPPPRTAQILKTQQRE